MRAFSKTVRRARALRRTMTRPETHLWGLLRQEALGLRFRRQHPLGVYVLDFYCPAARLAVEVDGATHWDDEARARDEARDRWLMKQGIYVHRVLEVGDVEKRVERRTVASAVAGES